MGDGGTTSLVRLPKTFFFYDPHLYCGLLTLNPFARMRKWVQVQLAIGVLGGSTLQPPSKGQEGSFDRFANQLRMTEHDGKKHDVFYFCTRDRSSNHIWVIDITVLELPLSVCPFTLSSMSPLRSPRLERFVLQYGCEGVQRRK